MLLVHQVKKSDSKTTHESEEEKDLMSKSPEICGLEILVLTICV